MLTAHTCLHLDSHTCTCTHIPAHMCPPDLLRHVLRYMHVLTHTHSSFILAQIELIHKHTCVLTHVHSYICSCMYYPYMLTRAHTHTLTRALHACPHVHSCPYIITHTHTHSTCRPYRFPRTPSGTPIPDGDHVPTVSLDVPAAVGARWVVEGPGGAVDDATPLRVLLQFPAAGGCQGRRRRSAVLTFG